LWSRGGSLVLTYSEKITASAKRQKLVKCRMPSLGCMPCTGADPLGSIDVPEIIEERLRFAAPSAETARIATMKNGSMESGKNVRAYF